MTDTRASQLQTLATLYGIQTSYVDGLKQRRHTSQEGLLALLHALGAPLKESTNTEQALRERRVRLWQQWVDPVQVAWGGVLKEIPIRIPLKFAHGFMKCSIRLEGEKTISWTCHASERTIVTQEKIEGTTFAEVRLPLHRVDRQKLPWGYHRLTIEARQACHETLIIVAPLKAYQSPTSKESRNWGIFIPLYALRSTRSWGIGDLTDLETLTKTIRQVGGTVVATLPLLPAWLDSPFDPSPYAPVSRLFWNELYLDIARLPETARCPEVQRLLASSETHKELVRLRSTKHVDYHGVMALKKKALMSLAQVARNNSPERRKGLDRYRQNHPDVESYAQFRATAEYRNAPWQEWPDRLKSGRLHPGDFEPANRDYHVYVQWVTEEQLTGVAAAGTHTDMGKGMYLDLPLGVHPSGYDVWREPELFVLGASGGAPPDAVFTKGQDWGFAPLHPDEDRHRGYRYVLASLRHHMAQAEMLRIDHVMACHRLFMIPPGMDPSHGAYVHYRPEELYALLTLESHRHRTTIVGENLGTVPTAIDAALGRHGIHTMFVVQYEVTSRAASTLAPIPTTTVASLNTHDMPPFEGYWEGRDIAERVNLGWLTESEAETEAALRAAHKKTLAAFLRSQGLLNGDTEDSDKVFAAALEWLGRSPASFVLVNLEDLWQETRPQNVPGTFRECANWTRKARYRVEDLQKLPTVINLLRDLDHARKNNSGKRTG